MALQVLDLFSGIGGMSLGLHWAGFQTAAFCENDPYARAVLAKNFPGVPCYDDVRTLTGDRLAADGIVPDLVCGGFPCQDISLAGKGAGLAGARSGLWFEFRRLIQETGPRWALIENSPALRSRGLDVVLGGLDALGFDAEWHCIPASAIGAPQRRDRVWIVAHAKCERWERRQGHPGGRQRHRVSAGWTQGADGLVAGGQGRGAGLMARSDRDAGHEGRTGNSGERQGGRHADRGGFGAHVPATGHGRGQVVHAVARSGRWGAEPGLGGGADGVSAGLDGAGWEAGLPRVAKGVPNRVDRLRCLGNAVVPQVVEQIGRAILAADAEWMQVRMEAA